MSVASRLHPLVAGAVPATLGTRLLRGAIHTLALVGGIALLVTLTPVANLLAGPLLAVGSAPERVDAMVVLSGGRYFDGSLNEASLERTVAAVRLYRLGFAPRVLFTGGPCCGESASALMAQLAVELGVPADAVQLEERSMRTSENARFCAAMLRQQHVDRVLLVTGALHLLRAQQAFEAAGVEVVPVRASRRDLALVSGAADRINPFKGAIPQYLRLVVHPPWR